LIGLIAYLVNELLIYFRHIAVVTKALWVISPQDAAKFFELFFVPQFAAGELGTSSTVATTHEHAGSPSSSNPITRLQSGWSFKTARFRSSRPATAPMFECLSIRSP
jgi:hypothetical protein